MWLIVLFNFVWFSPLLGKVYEDSISPLVTSHKNIREWGQFQMSEISFILNFVLSNMLVLIKAVGDNVADAGVV